MIGTQVIRARYESHLGRVAYTTIATIEKIYKNGNVVIGGLQYKPSIDKQTFHSVGRDDGFYRRSYYVVYDDEVKARIAEQEAFVSRQRRLRDVQAKLASLRDIDEERLAKLEEAFK